MLNVGEIVEAVGWVFLSLGGLGVAVILVAIAGEYVGHKLRMARRRREAAEMFEAQAQRRKEHRERLEQAEAYAQWRAHQKEFPLD